MWQYVTEYVVDVREDDLIQEEEDYVRVCVWQCVAVCAAESVAARCRVGCRSS